MGAPANRSTLHRRQPLRLAHGSWISLFAMLMIFIGPLISQAMPMDHHAGMSMQMSMDDVCHAAPQPPADPAKAPAADHVMWEKCGYCSLLFSCPALPGSVSFVALGSPPPATGLIPVPRLGHARQSIFPGARSRAPPSQS